MIDKLYYLQDSRSLTGDRIVFWADAGGYTTNVGASEAYNEADARGRNTSRPTDVPLLKSVVDAHTTLAVDCQTMRGAEEITPTDNNEYPIVIVISGNFNGNDLYFYPGTYDFENAMLFNDERTLSAVMAGGEHLKAYTHETLSARARRVFSPTPEILKKAKMKKLKKERKRNPLINCYTCGKFFNPETIQSLDCPHCDACNYP